MEQDVQDEVGLEGGSEDEAEVNSESGDEFDINSFNKSEGEFSTDNEGYEVEDDLYDVPVGGDDEVENELYEVRIKEDVVAGVRGSSGQKSKIKHVD